MRLDVALAGRHLVPSRERAQEAIRAGMVRVNGIVAAKASQPVTEADVIEVAGDPVGYVGRGGLKLEAALDYYGIDPSGRTCLDVGSSTGGFTDCLLRRGASQVFAVDVGRDQLHHALRCDPRVVVIEGVDIRTVAGLPVRPSLVTVDVAFISLTLVLPAVLRLAAPGAELLCLIKPQFEVGRAGIGKGGIVRDASLREEAVNRVVHAAAGLGLEAAQVIPSPIAGTAGNREYLVLLRLR